MTNAAYEGMWKLWSDGEDFVVARDLDGVCQALLGVYGEPEEGHVETFEEVPPDKLITIWEDSPGHNEQTKTAAEWVSLSDPGLLCSRNV